MISNKSQFLSFNDGVADVYDVENVGESGNTPKEYLNFRARLRFYENTVGMNRFYEAKQAKVDIKRVITTPLVKSVTTQDVVVINGQEYKIAQKQERSDTRPPSMILTLADRKAKL